MLVLFVFRRRVAVLLVDFISVYSVASHTCGGCLHLCERSLPYVKEYAFKCASYAPRIHVEGNMLW